MPTQITRNLIESWLLCKYKAHLKASGYVGTASDYEKLLIERRLLATAVAISRMTALHNSEQIVRGVQLTPEVLKQGRMYFVQTTLDHEDLCLQYDGLMRLKGVSDLGAFHYVPMLFL